MASARKFAAETPLDSAPLLPVGKRDKHGKPALHFFRGFSLARNYGTLN